MRRALLTLLLACSCGPVEVVLVDLDNAPDGGMDFRGPPCSANSDCMGDGFCERRACTDSFGRCRRRPQFCPPDANPVCGCNGVTYWNDCLRQSSGIAAATLGECVNGASCATQACPDSRASCARLVSEPSECSASLESTCWVLPDVCPASAQVWQACNQGPRCSDLCGAIRSQHAYARVPSCQ